MPRWPSGKVSTSEPEGSRPRTHLHRRSAVYVGLLPVKPYVRGQTSTRWCGAKIPTMARPTHEECKAGREGTRSGVVSSSDRGSKGRRPS
ncbi:hypothetical protein AVEN_53449-1 [Araneus ventricosus]|uniref:Uncharacterized protein n=1 Tax=Araneus ventricosus TaxID=182803 RepID=A0A4Y2ABT7_ARAVE|nr:hypothetical protein AVEN_53449-1 [Araneus ventricosus]